MILVKDIIGMEIIVGKYEFIAPCHFGLEAVLKKEIIRLGYEIVKVEDGKVVNYRLPKSLSRKFQIGEIVPGNDWRLS